MEPSRRTGRAIKSSRRDGLDPVYKWLNATPEEFAAQSEAQKAAVNRDLEAVEIGLEFDLNPDSWSIPDATPLIKWCLTPK